MCTFADGLPTWHDPAVSVAHWSCPHLSGLGGLQPLIRSERGKSRLPVPKASGEVNPSAQTIFNLWRLDEVSHLAHHRCVLMAEGSPDLLSAGVWSWGLTGIWDQRRSDAPGGAAAALFCLSSCWPSAGSCCRVPSPGPPRWKEERLALPASCARAVWWIRLADRPE